MTWSTYMKGESVSAGTTQTKLTLGAKNIAIQVGNPLSTA